MDIVATAESFQNGTWFMLGAVCVFAIYLIKERGKK